MGDGSQEWRILVVANETCAGPVVVDEVAGRAGAGPARVLIVAPALAAGRLGHWFSADMSRRRREAGERVSTAVEALRGRGVDADGLVGDGDPLQAIDDAVRAFAPDEIIVSTHPPDRSLWLERRVVERARARYTMPVTHIVVDADGTAAVRRPPLVPARRPGPRPVTLFHAATYEEALRIRERGFDDERDVPGAPAPGVVLTQEPPRGDDADGPLVFGVRVPADVAGRFEATRPGDAVRRFVIPAGLVNRYGPPEIVDERAE